MGCQTYIKECFTILYITFLHLVKLNTSSLILTFIFMNTLGQDRLRMGQKYLAGFGQCPTGTRARNKIKIRGVMVQCCIIKRSKFLFFRYSGLQMRSVMLCWKKDLVLKTRNHFIQLNSVFVQIFISMCCIFYKSYQCAASSTNHISFSLYIFLSPSSLYASLYMVGKERHMDKTYLKNSVKPF